MSLVKNLQRLIRTDGEVAGRVVSVFGTSVVVATAAGQMEVSANGNLIPGDLVTVVASRATKKQRGNDASVFFV